MPRKIVVIFIISLSLFAAAGCDDFSLLDQFNSQLSISPQKKSVQQEETIALNPRGGEKPYTFQITEEEPYYSGSTESTIDESNYTFTAGDSISKIRIVIIDDIGNIGDAVVTIIPPQPQNFSLDDSVSQEISLSWNTYDINGIDGIQIMRSQEGAEFVEIHTDPNGSSGYTDTTCIANKEYEYYIFTVAGSYASPSTPKLSGTCKP